MSRTIVVEVTQEHIDRGKRGDCGYCPVALAIKEALPFAAISAGMFISLDDENSLVRSPDAVRDFILAFDHRLPVSPFSFTLEIPDADTTTKEPPAHRGGEG